METEKGGQTPLLRKTYTEPVSKIINTAYFSHTTENLADKTSLECVNSLSNMIFVLFFSIKYLLTDA
jgi:hypothetical protein